MFNVQCPGCSAPYQVDERRVPQGGLRMRCPKCATSFVVEKPPATPAAPDGMTPAQAPRGAVPNAKASNPLKATMIGVAGPAMGSPRGLPGPSTEAAKGAEVPAPMPAAVQRKAPPPPRNREGLPTRAEAAPTLDDLPSVPRPKPAPPARDTTESDLPAALMPRSKTVQAAAPLPAVPAKPAPAAKLGLPEATPDDDWSLPELAKEPPLVTPASLNDADGDPEFSSAPSAFTSNSSNGARAIDVDLPAHKHVKFSKPDITPARDDLEIDLPSPFEAMTAHTDRGISKLDVDLDLPSLGNEPALPRVARGDLPAAAEGRLPAVPKRQAGLPAVPARRFGEVDLLPDLGQAHGQRALDDIGDAGLIPDLEAPLNIEGRTSASKGRTPSQAPLGAVGFELPDLTDALPIESVPPGSFESASAHGRTSSAPAAPAGLELGELNFDSSSSDAFGSNVKEAGPSIVRQSGGGTNFGEVSLDTGTGPEAIIGTIDERPVTREHANPAELEFGGVPQEAAAKEIPIDPGASREMAGTTPRKPPKGPTARAERRPMSRAVRYGAMGVLSVAVLGGASLAMVPDVGFFGYSFISDVVRKPEYDRLLAAQVAAARAALSSDTYPAAVRALDELERVQRAHPRARGLRAYLGFLGYAVDLRFGTSSERSSRSKVLLDQLTDKGVVAGLDLALTARAAGEGNLARAHKLIDEIRRVDQKNTEISVISAQIEMLDRRPGQSLVYWREVESSEHSARSAYGNATAELALGQVEAAEKSANNAISRQPKHVSARLMLARIALDKRGNVSAAEARLQEALQYQTDASPSEQVATQTLVGDLNLSRSRISVAEAAYAKALSLDPRSSPALRGLGEALYRAGRYAEALARFEAAVQADPDDTTAAVGVAKTQLSLERVRDAATLLTKLRTSHSQSYLVNYWHGAAQEAMGNREEAEKAFTSAIDAGGVEPAVIDAYIALALLKNQQGRREEAQKLLDTAREKLPPSPRILNAIGQVALSEGRYEAAIADFRQALKLDPTDIAATFRLGVALRKNRVFEDALKCFDEVAAVDHEYPGLALERGLLYENSGRTDEALKAFEDALSKAPNDADLMLRVGCGKVSAGRPKEAEDLLRKVLEQRPMSAETHHCLGRAQLLEGTNLAQALRTLERAVELDPYRPEYYLYVGWAANEAGRISTAEQALKKALSLDQGLGDAYWQRGVLRYRQGAVKDAVADLTKAIELRPSRSEAHAALAEAFYELGMEAKALEQWRIAVAAQPDNASWHFSLGKLLQAASRDADAKNELEKSLELGEKLDPSPRWIWEAHRLLARSIGMQPAAIPHWIAYLRLAPLDNAYRDEAKQALAKLGQRYEEK